MLRYDDQIETRWMYVGSLNVHAESFSGTGAAHSEGRSNTAAAARDQDVWPRRSKDFILHGARQRVWPQAGRQIFQRHARTAHPFQRAAEAQRLRESDALAFHAGEALGQGPTGEIRHRPA